MKRLLYILFILAFALTAGAQVSVESHLDSAQILVGSQTRLSVTVKNAPENANVEFPSFKDESEMARGLEVVRTLADSANSGDNDTRTYVLTAWDEGKYSTPSLTVKVNGKEFKTKPIPLQVNTIKVDTARLDSIRPMHGVADTPFAWSEWSPLFWLSIAALLLIVLAYYLYVRLRDNKPIIGRIRLVKRLQPHEKAMQKIEKIKAEHLAESTDQKEYYTELTDTLRQYLEDRFGIKAKEMTSSEIISRLERENDKSKIDELREVFETADLVKFAKYSVQNNINDMYLTSVVKFIDDTKQENAPSVEKVDPKLSAKEKRKMQTRKGVRLAIVVITVAAVAMLVYVGWRIFAILG